MSSGQKAYAEEIEDGIFDAKIKKLQSLSPAFVVQKLTEIKDEFSRIDGDNLSLPRNTWHRLDSINKKLKELGV